jgi:hypothetical protein
VYIRSFTALRCLLLLVYTECIIYDHEDPMIDFYFGSFWLQKPTSKPDLSGEMAIPFIACNEYQP